MTAQEAETSAYNLLAQVWDLGSTTPVPIDPIYIAQQLGIEVFIATLRDETAGMLVKEAGVGPKIYLNRGDHPNRQRFTCAHELGHYIKRTQGVDDESWEFVDRRDHLSGRGVHPDEVFANQFAAALLMPAESVKKQSQRLQPPELAYEFEVSLEAMKHRLSNLKLKQ